MKNRILMAALGVCLAATFATTAEARIDTGPMSSHYDGQTFDRPTVGKNFKAKSNRYASQKKKPRYASKTRKARYASKAKRNQYAKAPGLKARAVTAGAGGGGVSRGCLQPQAQALLNRIESQFGPVRIVSTCRPGAVIAGSGKPSKHRYGLAIDFDAGSRKGAIVSWLMQNHHSGGTMTYARMSHIHVDIGPKFVSLNSGGGRRRG